MHMGMTSFRLLLSLTAFATYALIVLGAFVRASGSGLGCPDWPTCHGGIIPPFDAAAFIESSHRWVAAAVSILIVASTGLTIARYWTRAHLLWPAVALPVLLTIQIVLGAITVLWELPPTIVLVHLTVALSILALLVWMACTVHDDAAGDHPDSPPELRRFRRMAWGAVASVFLLLMTGAYMRSIAGGYACTGFPGCNGELLPFGRSPVIDVHLTHRLVAYAVGLHLLFTALRGWRIRAMVPGLGRAVRLLIVAFLFQLSVGIGAVSSGVPAVMQILHVAGASALWAAIVAIAALATRPAGVENAGAGQPEAASPPQDTLPLGVSGRVKAYLALTKPGIISELLVTTLASMMVAARGMPELPLVVFTLVGGALSAGAANTFNCYIDRDIDGLMGRTSRRPIPAGIISPSRALTFGIVLGIAAIAVLGLLVNWLAALLSLFGFLYYVLVYTCWLKRSTPSNIVLGGAAGAVPPLVGWAAVTGEVSLLAVYLFAVIFLWTPPHFWALALMIRKEYEKARVPMLPNAAGDGETRKQIVVYSIILVAFTLLVVALREVGPFYLLAAAILGSVFLYHAVRLVRLATTQAARGLFRYSILYLTLLFVAMVIDRWRIA